MEHISKNQIKLIRSLQQKKFRDEYNLFVAEGEKCVQELMQKYELYMFINHDNATQREIEQISSLKTPQGTIGIFHKHQTDLPQPDITTNQLVLMLDGVQDPGNLGTIIRTADWFGIDHIICSTDTADCYNPKVVQATMGSLARVNLYYTNLKNFLQTIPDNIPIYGTLLDGKNIYQKQLAANGIIIMGNEGNGISPDIRRYITCPLLIPAFRHGSHAESLNVAVATALTLAEFKKR